MSIIKSQNARVMSEEAIQYLCKCINLVNSLPTSVIDNLHLADNLTFSSTKIDRLLTTLKEDCNKYTDSIIANFSRLELRVVTDEADMNEHNKLYLIKKAGETSYSQYVIVTNDSGVDEKILLGTCDISMTDYLKITDADSTYCKKTDFDALTTEVDKVKTTLGTKVNKTDIVDNLTSTDTDKPLSANQGKVLKDKVDTKANNSEVVKKTDVNTSLTSTPSTGKVYDANTINKIINTLNYNYNADTDINDIAVRKNAIIHALNDLNNSYNGVTNVNLPYATFVIRYEGGYYNTYILTAYGNNHTVEILEYSPYENYLNIWDISGGNFDSLTLRKSSQIFYNKDPYRISYTFTDETNYKLNTLTYSIRNGICYMRVEVKCVTPVSGYSTVGSIPNMGIPVPEVQEYKKLFDVVGNSMCGFYIGSGYIQMMGGTAGRTYQGSFSYPIKI